MRRWTTAAEVLAAVEDAGLMFGPPVTIHSRRSDGDTPLHVAAVWDDLGAIEMLVRAGADVNAVGDMGQTALHYVVFDGNIPAMQLLLAAGASPHIRSEFGRTAAETGLASGMPELAALFTESQQTV